MSDAGAIVPDHALALESEGGRKRVAGIALVVAAGVVGLIGVVLGLRAFVGGGGLGLLALAVPAVAVGAAVAAVGVKRFRLGEQMVTGAWEAVADAHGWRFEAEDRFIRPALYNAAPFQQGHTRIASRIIEGEWKGMPFDLFTYRFTVTTYGSKGQRNDTTYYHKIAATRAPIDGNGLAITPETLGKKLLDMVGAEDIDTESDEFSRRFWVKCRDRRFAYDILHPRMMDHLLASSDDGSWQWPDHFLLHARQGVMRLHDAGTMLAALHGFWTRIPRHRLAEAPPQRAS